MSLTAGAIAIRLALSTTSNPPRPPIDLNTGKLPQFWRGDDVDFQTAIFGPDGDTIDLSNVAFLELDIYPVLIPPTRVDTNQSYSQDLNLPFPSRPPAPLLSRTLVSEQITAELTAREWLDQIDQQAVFSLTSEETASLNLDGRPSKTFFLVVHGLTTSGRKLTFAGGNVEVYESGSGTIYLPREIAPVEIPLKTTLHILENQQLANALPIVIEGDLILDGYLIELGGTNPFPPITDENMQIPPLIQTGELQLNQPFGLFVTLAQTAILGIQIAAQTPADGADVIIELIDQNGASLSRTATLPDGAEFVNVTFGTPLTLTAGSYVRARAKQIGSINPGGYVTANLITQILS